VLSAQKKNIYIYTYKIFLFSDAEGNYNAIPCFPTVILKQYNEKHVVEHNL